ncbi:MAG TPA: FAD-dependent oxidoreductase [Solirubrobacteraceae bacterium]|nr:FAD-dependent oxidoreductase [Solirubrobacteraceae bacterium]
MNSSTSPTQPFRALIAGGGVAAVEAALALRDLAADRIAITLLAPEPDFVYRPMRVREPFGYALAQRHSLEEIARDVDAELVPDAVKWLDPGRSVVHTEHGQQLRYDALLIALGAHLRPAFAHAITVDDDHIDEQLHGLLQDIEGGYVSSLAFLAPSPLPWPLPIYELALMTATRAYDMGVRISITIATPEQAPLALFGSTVSDGVKRLLDDRGIATIPSAHCTINRPGVVSIDPGGRTLLADRVVALPQLFGPSVPGLSAGTQDGFIPVDVHCRVRGIERVWAAGDATDFPVKHGGIAAQQADTAAAAIAAVAGAPVQPAPFHPEIRAVLLGGEQPLYLSAHVTGGHGSDSSIREQPTWSPPAKIAAKYLSPYLEARGTAALR